MFFLCFFVWLLSSIMFFPECSLAVPLSNSLPYQKVNEQKEADSTIKDFWEKHMGIGGWVDVAQSIRTSSPYDAVTSRARGRLELSGEFENIYFFVSADAEKNWSIPDEDGFSIHEAWVEYLGNGWDVRLGRQLIIWGNADGLRITDNISPTDFTEYLNRGIDEMRIPVTAAKMRFMQNNWITELIWIPEFKAEKQPTGENPWAIDYTDGFSLPVVWRDADEPSSFSLENSEFAVKLSSYFAGFDVSLSAFYTWDDSAANYYELQNTKAGPTLVLTPEHHRIMIYGLDFAKPWSDFVFRGESAYFQGRYLPVKNEQPKKYDVLKALIGVDWTIGNNWSLTAQIYDEWIIDYNPNLNSTEHTPQGTLSISKTLFNEILIISNVVYFSFNDGEYFNRLQGVYELAEGLKLTVGWDIFQGGDSSYGVYKDNSQIWAKMRYTF